MTARRHSIEVLRDLHREKQAAIQARLRDFSQVQPTEYFYELAYCLMTPQSSAVHADKVIEVLKQRDFLAGGFDPEPVLRTKEHYIRFHKNKSRYLLRIRETLSEVLRSLSNGTSGIELREWLVKNVKGLGYKEATHFLRNIGKNEGLAILDRHILRNLHRYGVIRKIPDSLSKKLYLATEKKFQKFAVEIGIPLDELDLLFWSMETGEIRK